MIRHQFSDRSRFVIKAAMKDRYKEGMKDFRESIKKGEWKTSTKRIKKISKDDTLSKVFKKLGVN